MRAPVGLEVLLKLALFRLHTQVSLTYEEVQLRSRFFSDSPTCVAECPGEILSASFAEFKGLDWHFLVFQSPNIVDLTWPSELTRPG